MSKGAVRAAWDQLNGSDVHTHFLGYLAIREVAAKSGAQTDLAVDFKGFFQRFLAAGGMTADVPYVKPFGGPTQNKNIAGSYARSSLRGVAPLIKVASIRESHGKSVFSLLDEHSNLALRYLLNDKPISGVALAVFLYRDYLIDGAAANSSGLSSILSVDFGFTQSDFAKLLSVDFEYAGDLFR